MTDFLYPTDGPVKERKYSVIDIETKDGETQNRGLTRPFLASWYDPENGHFETRGPDCIKSMIAFACRDVFDGWCFYAHYGGNFDWLHFLPFIHAMGFHYEILIVGSGIQLLHVKPSVESHRRGWFFLDSHKLIPISLEKAAKAFGVQAKVQVDLDLHEDSPEWLERVRGDCYSTYEILKRYHELVVIRLRGEVGITAASTAMRTFRRGWQKAPIYRHVTHHELFRSAYYGGRVERFASKVEGVRVYDINSSYPWSMSRPQPVGQAYEWTGTPTRLMLNQAQDEKLIGFVRARVRVPDDTYIPCLPVRQTLCNGEQKLMFPVGEFDGVWDYLEIARAIREGAEVLEWRESVWIDAGDPFSEMVTALYAYRDTSRDDYDEGLATVSKILLNSLYGKFATKQDREKLVRIAVGEPIPDGARASDPLNELCELWYLSQDFQADYMCPQIAAHITTLSRLRLHDYFLLAHERGILAYGDTDSIHTTADLDEFLGSKLGMLKDEGKGERFSAEYLQPKVYLLDSGDELKLTMKGYQPPKKDRPRAERLAYYERVKAGEAVTFEALEKIGSLAKRQFASAPRMRSVARSLKTEDTKRIMLTATMSRAVKI